MVQRVLGPEMFAWCKFGDQGALELDIWAGFMLLITPASLKHET